MDLEGIEISGYAFSNIIKMSGMFNSVLKDIFKNHQIDNFEPNSWYPVNSFMDVLEEINEKVGANAVHKIGLTISKTAEIPIEVKSIYDFFSNIDKLYHLNHRKDGKAMCDAQTEQMQDGIGHYIYEKIEYNNLKITCTNPYPCDFNLGLIEGFAQRFATEGKKIYINHSRHLPCKKNGDASCIYFVTWV
ncbi:MAG: hypothetical protein JW871_04765 [Endomicrobiales bacterium]|nr:hypothetical protein [Endomicrobiales bacterium]